MKRRWKALLVLVVLGLVPPIADAGKNKNEKHSTGANTRTQTFSVNKGDTLQVGVESGDIWISGWEKNEVSIKVEGIDR